MYIYSICCDIWKGKIFCDEHSREPNFAFLLKSDLFLTHLEFTFHSYNYKRLHGIIDWQLEYINIFARNSNIQIIISFFKSSRPPTLGLDFA